MSRPGETRSEGHRGARLLAWGLVGLYMVMMLAGLALQFVSGRFFFVGSAPPTVFVALMMSVTAIIGALLISRQPRHPAGWVWLTISLAVGLDLLSFGFVNYGLHFATASGAVAGLALLWQTFNALPIGLVAFTILMLTFPNGRFLTPRWRLVALASIVAIVIYMPLATVRPGPYVIMPFLDNPRGTTESAWRVLGPIMWSALVLAVLALLAAIISLFLRLWRAQGADRHYIKWLLYAMILFMLGVAIQQSGYALGLPAAETLFLLGLVLQIVAFAGLATAIVIAIYRYHLYDIDVIIHRTLVYGLLTLLLAVIYFGSIVLLQQLLQPLTRQESPLVVVVSTLLIFALFSPLRRRIQDFIDRRFYRRKYDAAQTLAQFAATARDEVDLNRLTGELLRAIDETVQPESLSIWLKER